MTFFYKTIAERVLNLDNLEFRSSFVVPPKTRVPIGFLFFVNNTMELVIKTILTPVLRLSFVLVFMMTAWCTSPILTFARVRFLRRIFLTETIIKSPMKP
jgi:hypothetical protein